MAGSRLRRVAGHRFRSPQVVLSREDRPRSPLEARRLPEINLLARRISGPIVLSPHGVFSAASLAKSRLNKRVSRRLFELRRQAAAVKPYRWKTIAVDYGARYQSLLSDAADRG